MNADLLSERLQQLEETANFLKKKLNFIPKNATILGSGLGHYTTQLEILQKLSFHEIPHFYAPKVSGHPGELVVGRLPHSGKRVLVLRGRIHFYEGHSMWEVTYPTRVLCELGIQNLIITNAAGGINAQFMPGDLMLITDHINLMGESPFRGPQHDKLGPRFPDFSQVYCFEKRKLVLSCAQKLGIALKQGIYAGVPGPAYETPAEVRYLRIIGADAVGMSTVPEASVAHQKAVSIIGLSCIANAAAGLSTQALHHQEVVQVAQQSEPLFTKLLNSIFDCIDYE